MNTESPFTDEKLRADLENEDPLAQGVRRRAAMLLQVPLEARSAVAQEAVYVRNRLGGRYSDALMDAVRRYSRGEEFTSSFARSMDPR